MDFDKTSFSVDWFTPGDRYTPKRLSFPKSARISIDDLVSDSPLGFCFSPVDEAIQPPHSYSFVETPFERARGWTTSAPPSPLVPSHRERYPMYEQDPKPCEENPMDWRTLASPGLLSVANDCALCGVDLDVSCLDALDEQLLLLPVESFTDLCWEAAVDDEVMAPVIPRRNTRSRAHSFKHDHERAFPPPLGREYPGSFERTRPLAAKITLPLETFPHYLLSSSSESLDTPLMPQQKRPAHILYTNPRGSPLALHTQGTHMPRRSKLRDPSLTPSFNSLAQSQPSKCSLQPSQPSHARRIISDACLTLTRARRKPLQSPSHGLPLPF